MNALYIFGFLIGAFVLVTIFTFARAYLRAASHSPAAREQCMYWRAMHNNAFADGDHLAAKLYKAKELVVHATNHPITTFGGSVPRLCIEGQLESKSEEELDELIEILSSLSKEKREELRKLQ
jgi:hypothetical protein